MGLTGKKTHLFLWRTVVVAAWNPVIWKFSQLKQLLKLQVHHDSLWISSLCEVSSYMVNMVWVVSSVFETSGDGCLIRWFRCKYPKEILSSVNLNWTKLCLWISWTFSSSVLCFIVSLNYQLTVICVSHAGWLYPLIFVCNSEVLTFDSQFQTCKGWAFST